MRIVLSLGTALASGAVVPAFAQTAPPADVRQSIDGNGVDLFTGKLAIQGPVLSIGGGDTGMRYYKIYRNQGWSDNMIATMNISGTTVTVTFGGTTDRFTQSGSTYTPTEANGATLTFASNVYTYTMRDGTVAHFNKTFAGTYPFYATEGRVTDITAPNGETLTFTYQSLRYCSASKPGGTGTICTTHTNAYRLSSVKNRYGYALSFTYPDIDADPEDPDSGFNVYNWGTSNGLALNNLAVPGTSISGTGFTNNYHLPESYGYGSSGITTITHPGSSSVDVTYGYTSGRVTTVATAAGTTNYAASDAGAVRTVVVTNPAGQPTTYTFDIASQRMTAVKDGNNYTTSYQYDASGRLTRTTYPELNYVQLSLDARGNVTQTTAVPKPNSGMASIVTSAVYPTNCTNAATCNQPTSTTDARGAVTDYTYDPTHGGVLTVTAPAPTTGAVRPQVRYSYTQLQAYYSNGSSIVASGQTVWRLTGTSTCQVNATCAGTADEVKTTISYGPQTGGVGNNLLPVSTGTGAGNAAPSDIATTAVTYDAIGNAVMVDGPLPGTADTTRIRYDSGRQVVGVISPDPDGTGPLKDRAVRTTYDAKGRATLVEQGTVTDQSDTAWNAFSAAQAVATTYDGVDRPLTVSLVSGSTTYALTQYFYDAAGHTECVAQRMNPSLYGSLPAYACTPTTTGPNGADQITRYLHDAAGNLGQMVSGQGSATPSTENYTVSPNGQRISAGDGENNTTTYTYDGLDRLVKTNYPVPTQGQNVSNASDYEQLTYDANGNIISRRLRDGNTIGYSYDALNRLKTLTPAGLTSDDTPLTYAYDNLGRLTFASRNATNQTTMSYDALGRKTLDTNYYYSIASQYDIAGRRTRETWNGGFYVTFNYLVTGEMSSIQEANGYTPIMFGYDDLGRRTSLTRGNGTTTSYAYDAVSRLAGLSHDMPGTANDLSLGFSYNPASQIASVTRSNDAYAWTGHSNLDRPNTVNGLNQLTTVGTGALGYDARGNLSTSGGQTYQYTSLNRLANVPGVTMLSADAFERQEYVSAEARLLGHDGDHIAVEVDQPSQAVQRRYVWGPGADEPLIWYEGNGTSDRRYLHADERGSIVAVSDGTGNVLAKNSYDEYGVPGPGNLGRFQYTGQAYIPSLGLYDYKARMYSSRLGRFMQTDPIGYGDGMNWYNYTGSDPVNKVDPSGSFCSGTQATTGLPSGDTTPCFDPGPLPADWWNDVVVNHDLIPVYIFSYDAMLSPMWSDAGGASSRSTVATNSSLPQNPQVTCNTALPNGKTVGDAVRGAINDTLTPSADVGSNTDAAADMQAKMAMYTFPHGPMDFKNKFRGQADPTFLAAAGNFAYGAYVSALAGPSVSNFGAKLYGTVAGWLGLKSAKFLAPNGMSKSGAANVPRGNANAGCSR